MKRHRVRLRPKARRRRRSAAGIVASMFLLGAVGAGVALMRPWRWIDLPKVSSIPLPRAARIETLSIIGAPKVLAGRLWDSLNFRPGELWGLRRPGRTGVALSKRFSCLKTVRVRRSWSKHSLRIEVEIRKPVAVVPRESGSRFLDREGVIFSAPDGLFDPAGLPTASLDELPEGTDLGPLGDLLSSARSSQALPSRLVAVRFDREEGGWEASLEDGTTLLWGRLRWTELKLDRLREVLSDARPRFEAALIADLRYFEDGKILIRPR